MSLNLLRKVKDNRTKITHWCNSIGRVDTRERTQLPIHRSLSKHCQQQTFK